MVRSPYDPKISICRRKYFCEQVYLCHFYFYYNFSDIVSGCMHETTSLVPGDGVHGDGFVVLFNPHG
jgi:hypothetical protein